MKTNGQTDKRPVLRYFVSYEHKMDGAYKADLMKRLSARLKTVKDYRFELWGDSEIDPGDDWHESIQAAIRQCEFGLLLVSPYFLASEYIQRHELPAFIAAEPDPPKGSRRAVPVALQAIDFSGDTDLKGLEACQIFMHKGRAYSLQKTNPDKEEFVAALCQKIVGIAKRCHPIGAAVREHHGEPEPLADYIEPEPPQAAATPASNPVSDTVRMEIRAEIGKLLRKPALLEINAALMGQQGEREPRIDPEAWLVPSAIEPFPIAEKIDALHDAVYAGLDLLKEQRPQQLTAALQHSKEILERLLVLAVPDAWVPAGGRHPGGRARGIDIPEKYPLWAEVGYGRLTQSRPRLELEPGPDPIRVFAPRQLGGDDLERGLTHGDALTGILREVWIKVQKREPSPDENWQAQLPLTLKRRARDGERYHFAIDHRRFAAVGRNPVWAEKLGDTLAHLGIFIYGAGAGDPLLIVPEDDLLVAIREYLRLLRKYE